MLTTGSSTEITSFLPVDGEQQHQQARTRQESDHFASLAEQHYVEINIATPTPSMRRGMKNECLPVFLSLSRSLCQLTCLSAE